MLIFLKLENNIEKIHCHVVVGIVVVVLVNPQWAVYNRSGLDALWSGHISFIKLGFECSCRVRVGDVLQFFPIVDTSD